MAITQPGGAGTTIYIYDDTDNTNHAAAPGPHTWAEIAAAFGADFVSNGAASPDYLSGVTVQIGDTGTGSATTTLTDATDATVKFAATRTLAFRSTQTTSWNLNLGTKVGSGSQATGINGGTIVTGAATTLRGTWKFYGTKWKQTTGALSMTVAVDNTCEAINSMFQSSAAAASPFVVGSSTSLRVGTLYNVDFSHTLTSSFMITNFFVANAERLTYGAPSPANIISSGSQGWAQKDCAFFGSPSQSDIRSSSGFGIQWSLVRPKWTGNAAKFSATTVIAVANAEKEYWLYDVKCVTGDGDAVSGIPVKLTDSTGEVQVNTTTGSNGLISFGSGLTANAVCVMDHYTTTGPTYAQRSRSPFLVEINMPTQSGYNNNYFSHRYYFTWPGDESVTTTSGTFEDVADVIQMSAVTSGGGTTWTETPVP